LLATGAFLVVAAAPIMRALVTEVRVGADQVPLASAIATGVYNLYCLFVSESVAPWFWAPGIAAAVAIAGTLLLVFDYGEAPARRFLLYFVALLAAMTLLQIGSTKRLMMTAPWLILAIGITLATATLPSARRLLAGTGGRDWLVRYFLAQTLRRAALDRNLAPGGKTGRGS
jgi:hypothetical protein